MNGQDIRWHQRLANYSKALFRLSGAIEAMANVENFAHLDLMKEGLIQRFEFTQELAWKLLKDYLEYQGPIEIRGSRDAFRQALIAGLIDEEAWLDTIKARNLTSHTYDDEVADEVYTAIVDTYYPLMKRLEKKMNKFKVDGDI